MKTFTTLILILASTLSMLAAEDQIHESRSAHAGGQLVVDVNFGSIEVTPGENDKVVVQGWRKVEGVSEEKAKQYLADTPVLVTTEGDKVIVREKHQHNSLGGFWNWLGHSHTDAHYAIRVPANFNLDLETAGGAIEATGTTGAVKADTSGGAITAKSCAGAINLDTSGGHIEVTNSRGKLRAETSGGHVTVSNFAGDASVESSGGKLRLADISGKLGAETSGGAIEAILSSPVVGDVKLETSAGAITVLTPKNADLDIDAETGAGHVSTDLPLTGMRSEHDSLKGTLNGGGKKLVLRSGAGSIEIAADKETAQQ